MSKHMSLPVDLVSEWLDPRKPEDVPRREVVKWSIPYPPPTRGSRIVEMTNESAASSSGVARSWATRLAPRSRRL